MERSIQYLSLCFRAVYLCRGARSTSSLPIQTNQEDTFLRLYQVRSSSSSRSSISTTLQLVGVGLIMCMGDAVLGQETTEVYLWGGTPPGMEEVFSQNVPLKLGILRKHFTKCNILHLKTHKSSDKYQTSNEKHYKRYIVFVCTTFRT